MKLDHVLALTILAIPLSACGTVVPAPEVPKPPPVVPVPNGARPAPLLEAESTRVKISLEGVPQTRIRCVAANLSTGREVRIEWDPADLTSFVKRLDLPGKPTDWTVSCAADKSVLSSSGLLYELSFKGGKCEAVPPKLKDTATCKLTPMVLRGASSNGLPETKDGEAVIVKMENVQATTTIVLVPATPPIAPGDRSVDPVSGVGADLLKILAEIAVDRAKQGTFELVRDTLKDGVCNHVRPLKLGVPYGPPLLPRTCETLEALRLEDLSAASTNLGRPLAQDFTRLASKQMVDRLDRTLASAFPGQPAADKAHLKAWLREMIEEIATLSYDVAAGGQAPDRMAHSLLTRLGEAPLGNLCNGDPATEECKWAVGAEVVLQILSVCAAQEGSCKPADISRMIGKPDDFLNVTTAAHPDVIKTHLEALRSIWPNIDALVMKGLEVVQPRPGVTQRETATNVVELIAGLLEPRLCAETEPGTVPDSCRSLRAGRDLVLAVLRDQSHETLIAGVKVLLLALEIASREELSIEQQRAIGLLTQLAGTVTAYAATYTEDTTGNPEKEKQVEETRRKAVEGFIDAYTDRSTRGGQWVTSVGGLAGFGVGGFQTRVSSSREVETVIPHLSIPMGIAIQKLPHRRVPVGFHSQISFVDLAQFIATDGDAEVFEPTWANAFTIGGSLGFLFGTPTSSIMLGTDLRYSPALNAVDDDVTKAKGSLRWSIGMAGYYVPFFDVN